MLGEAYQHTAQRTLRVAPCKPRLPRTRASSLRGWPTIQQSGRRVQANRWWIERFSVMRMAREHKHTVSNHHNTDTGPTTPM